MTSIRPGNRRVGPGTIRPRIDQVPLDHDSPLPGPSSRLVCPPLPPTRRGLARAFDNAGATGRLIAGAVVVAVVSTGMAYGTRRYLTTSPRFSVRTFLVNGVHRRTAQDVVAAGGLELGATFLPSTFLRHPPASPKIRGLSARMWPGSCHRPSALL